MFRLSKPKIVRNTTMTVLSSSVICACLFISDSLSAYAQRQTTRRAPASQPNGEALNATAKAALDAAVAALQSNSLAEAETQARAAVAAGPRSAVTHNVLGVILDRSGKTDEASKEFNTAIRLDANFVSARNNLDRMLAEHGKRDEAIAELERVLKDRKSTRMNSCYT